MEFFMKYFKIIFFVISFMYLFNSLSFADSERYLGIGTGFSLTDKSVEGESSEVYWGDPSKVVDDYKYKPGFEFNFMNIWDNGYIAGFIFDYNAYTNIKDELVSDFGAKNYYEFASERLALNVNFGYINDFNYFISAYGLVGIQYNSYFNKLTENRFSPSNNLIGGGFENTSNSSSVGLALIGGFLYRLNDLLSANLSFKYYYNTKAGVIQTDKTDFYIKDNGFEASLILFITF
jgi:hypothetical protein